MIKLIASDIDGTLLPEGTDLINPEIFDYIKKLKKKGITFVAASGRHRTSMERLFGPVRDDIFMITENGAYVCQGDRDILECNIDREYVREWVMQMRQIPDTSFNLDTKDEFFTESRDGEFIRLIRDGYKSRLIVLDDATEIIDSRNFIKMAAYSKNDLKTVHDILVPAWKDRLHCTVAGDIWVDFMKTGTDKGAALKTIQESLGISPLETMAFGDNQNDIEMLNRAAFSYAVGNAKPEVVAAAKYMTDSNVNDGVLKVLRTLV